ncbi:hypothetical protein GBF38_022043, partial [Nibea albiflora]
DDTESCLICPQRILIHFYEYTSGEAVSKNGQTDAHEELEIRVHKDGSAPTVISQSLHTCNNAKKPVIITSSQSLPPSLSFPLTLLQKLYPAAPKLEKEPSPPRFVETLAKKNYVKRTAPQEDTAAEESVHDSNEDQDKEEGEEEEGYKRRRRRRKRKPSLHQDSGKDGAAPESTSGQSQMHVDERGECVSKNRKRK